MNYSLNEVEALAKKATRGAGYPWGVAEEASKAVRFLCAHGLDGCDALVDVLAQFDHTGPGLCRPVCTEDVWRASKGPLCPITLGTILSDRADQVSGKPLRADKVVQPALLVPFMVQVARAIDQTVMLTAGPVRAVGNGKSVSVEGAWPAHAEHVTLEIGGTLGSALPTTSRAVVKENTWAKLNAFAHRTYAPATEESRMKGAG